MNRKKLIRKQFRDSVFKRDGYRCKCCNEPGTEETLDAHHIIDRNEMPNGGYVKENGISLCGKCHILAEYTHQGFTPPEGYDIPSLYALIDSSEEKARKASERLG